MLRNIHHLSRFTTTNFKEHLKCYKSPSFRSSNTSLNAQSKMSCRVPFWYKYHIDSLRFDTQSTDCPSNPSKIRPLIAEDSGAALPEDNEQEPSRPMIVMERMLGAFLHHKLR